MKKGEDWYKILQDKINEIEVGLVKATASVDTSINASYGSTEASADIIEEAPAAVQTETESVKSKKTCSLL